MRDVERACPIRIRSMLTDNGEAFTDCPFGLSKRAATGRHEFDILCSTLGIEQRLIHQDRRKPTEWSSGSTAALRTCCKATIFNQAMNWGRRCAAMSGFTNTSFAISIRQQNALTSHEAMPKNQTRIVQETAVLHHGM